MGRDWADPHGDATSRILDESAKRKGADRLLNNENISMDDVLESHRHSTVLRCAQQPVVLAVQDSTTLNFDTMKHATALTSIGGTAQGALLISMSPLPGMAVGCWG